MEEALQNALDAGRIKIPVVKVDFSAWSPTGNKPNGEKFIDDVGVITSLQVPHRLADAILRDSQTKDGKPFRESEYGKALNAVSQRNATALYRLCPTGLLFGMWDSTGPKGGLGAKFERAMVSEVVGIGASIHETHKARGVRRDPLEIRKAIPILKAADKSWSIADPKVKNVQAPSDINHGNVTFDSDNAGTTIEYAEQLTTLSLIVLRRLRFPLNGAPTPEVDVAGRTVLAALGLCAATLAFESGLALRSRCLVWPEEPMTWELLEKPGDEPRKFTLSSNDAIALLNGAVEAARKAKLNWEETPVELVPQPKLADLVRLSQQEATKGEDNAQ
jgi:CRISPR-associated protein Csb1